MNFPPALVFVWLYCLKYAVASPPMWQPQPLPMGQFYSTGLGVQIFVTELAPESDYVVNLVNGAGTDILFSMSANSDSDGNLFAILQMPFNLAPGSYIVDVSGLTGSTIAVNYLALPLFPPLSDPLSGTSDSYQSQQTISIPFLVNYGSTDMTMAYLANSTSSGTIMVNNPFPVTFSQNASAYVGTAPLATPETLSTTPMFVYLEPAAMTGSPRTHFITYRQPLVQSSRIPSSLLLGGNAQRKSPLRNRPFNAPIS